MKGKCTECGLDNTKNDRRYHLNIHNEQETRFHRGSCEEHLNQGHDSRKARENAGEDTGQAESAAARAEVLRERSRTGTVKKKSGWGRFALWIVILVIAFAAVANILTEGIPDLGLSGEGFSSLIRKWTADEDADDADAAEDAAVEEVFAERPEEIVWNEQSSGYFEEGLTMGIYTVGYEIPAGTYQLFCEEGTAWFYVVEQEEGSIAGYALFSLDSQESYAEFYGECRDYERSVPIRLQTGDIIYVEDCDEGIFIKGEGEGKDSLLERQPQELSEVRIDQNLLTAGEDFEPGVYDVTLGGVSEDEYGSAYLKVETTGEFENWFISLHQEMPVFYRFSFEKGDSVELTVFGANAAVTLVPSY